MKILITTRLIAIDCLRAFAAFFVFLFHLSALAKFDKRILPPVSFQDQVYNHIPNFFSLGSTGVNLFFVLSGFVLFLRYHNWDNFGILKYYRNRLIRIAPTYWVALIISVCIVFYLDGLFNFGDILLHSLFLHGLHPAYFLSINGAFWSMATEVQFYLFFPMLLLAFNRWIPWKVTLSAILLTLVCRYTILQNFGSLPVKYAISSASLITYQLPGRLGEFCLGMFLAFIYLSHRVKQANVFLGLFSIVLIPCLYFRIKGPEYMVDPAFGVLYFALTGYVVFSKILERSGRLVDYLSFFGKMSYSFFLIHLPVSTLVVYLFPSLLVDNLWNSLGRLLLVTFPASAIAGYILYRFIEEPIYLKFKKS